MEQGSVMFSAAATATAASAAFPPFCNMRIPACKQCYVKTTEGLTPAGDALALMSMHVLSGRPADAHLHGSRSWSELVLTAHAHVHAKHATLVY